MVQSGRERNPVWVVFFVDDAISMKSSVEGGRRDVQALTASLADAQLHTMGGRREGDEPPALRKVAIC